MNQGQKQRPLTVFVTRPHKVVIIANEVITHKALITAYTTNIINVRFSTDSAMLKSTSRVIDSVAPATVTEGFPQSLSVLK